MIEFAADESFSPIIDEELQVFEAAYPKAKLTPIYTDEIKAINMLLSDSVHLVIISRKFFQKQQGKIYTISGPVKKQFPQLRTAF